MIAMNMIKRVLRFLELKKRNAYLKNKCTGRDTVRMGNEYGGFNICGEGLKDKSLIVYSFGIGEDLSFSESILKNYEAKVYAFDPTPKSVKYVENSDLSKRDDFAFYPVGLSDRNEKAVFYLPENDDWVSGSSVITKDKKETGIEVEMKNLYTIMSENGHDHLDILKMDIEGSEFKVVDEWKKDTLPRIGQICVEVHDRYFDEGFKMLEGFLDKLGSLGYELISVSDTCEELTFLKKD